MQSIRQCECIPCKSPKLSLAQSAHSCKLLKTIMNSAAASIAFSLRIKKKTNDLINFDIYIYRVYKPSFLGTDVTSTDNSKLTDAPLHSQRTLNGSNMLISNVPIYKRRKKATKRLFLHRNLQRYVHPREYLQRRIQNRLSCNHEQYSALQRLQRNFILYSPFAWCDT